MEIQWRPGEVSSELSEEACHLDRVTSGLQTVTLMAVGVLPGMAYHVRGTTWLGIVVTIIGAAVLLVVVVG